ncbi:mannosyltransferase family protein [Thermogemmatispora sp.]|uniref:mannosyltransferase family protein n=1 Tax=Thermogemmatispora sp. TaxID=1968838 RepID=UPI001DEB4C81|nr:mannosyltransferase family protein [Thermogemmatispora sp.]MBX5449702.1 glycosyltransferase family 39 protein [Thermogemmatispora sp.]
MAEQDHSGKAATDGPGVEAISSASIGSPWLRACHQALPVYTATHTLYFLLSYIAFLFPGDSSSSTGPVLQALIKSWNHWDTSHFITIALHGYSNWWRTAFYPLYPLLIRLVNYLADNPVLAGLVVSNLTGFGVLVLLYRIIAEDFGDELASRTVLYYATFPMAFFLAAAYSESLFMLLSLLCFYALRRGYWWQAALWGGLSSLTRVTALPLLIPFAYEYLRQHHFRLREFHLDALSILGIPGGLALFAGYCGLRFHDPLAFSHAESLWQRSIQPPWFAFSATAAALIQDASHLDFITIHRAIDLALLTVVLALVILHLVGPWRFQGASAATYTLYTLTSFIFFLLVPAQGRYPTMSMPRYALVLFPAFLVLARLGSSEGFRLHYLIISGGLLTFTALQFLIGQWAG